jgi:hypothetical protein
MKVTYINVTAFHSHFSPFLFTFTHTHTFSFWLADYFVVLSRVLKKSMLTTNFVFISFFHYIEIVMRAHFSAETFFKTFFYAIECLFCIKKSSFHSNTFIIFFSVASKGIFFTALWLSETIWALWNIFKLCMIAYILGEKLQWKLVSD